MRSLLAPLALALVSCGTSAPIAQATQSPGTARITATQPSGITTLPVPDPAVSSGSAILMEAFGTEPFWSVNVLLGSLTYKTPDALGWVVIDAKLTDLGDRLRYDGKLDGKDFILEIGKGQCSDGMSDTVHQFTAKLTIGTETLQGCARAK